MSGTDMRYVSQPEQIVTEDDYIVTLATDPVELRRENATLRSRLREKEAECARWARRWAASGENDER